MVEKEITYMYTCTRRWIKRQRNWSHYVFLSLL